MTAQGTRLAATEAVPRAPRVRGRVQNVLPERGYGFVRALDGPDAGTDYFFHASSLLGCDIAELRAGSAVEFEPSRAAKGWRAERISRVVE